MYSHTNPDAEWVVPTILKRAEESGVQIEGPAEIEYGFGWEPTSTFWVGRRRIHFYYDIHGFFVIEVSDLDVEHVQRAAIDDPELAWEIVRRFLTEGCAFEDLLGLAWITDNLDHDKFIPDPPGKPEDGNIVSFIDAMKQAGATLWHPPEETDGTETED